MKKIPFLAIDLVLTLQSIVMVLGTVCAVYLLIKIWRNKNNNGH
jgi:hypothetical protein